MIAFVVMVDQCDVSNLLVGQLRLESKSTSEKRKDISCGIDAFARCCARSMTGIRFDSN